jgi:hypothetical protein
MAERVLKKIVIKLEEISHDMTDLGEIFVDDQLIGTLGIEKDYWTDADPDFAVLEQIHISLQDASGKVAGVINERVIKELAQSDFDKDLPLFTISLEALPYIIDIEKNSGKLVFPLITGGKRKVLEFFQISKKTLAIHDNYLIKRKIGDMKAATIDSKGRNKIEIQVYDNDLAQNEDFLDLLVLFAGTIKFHEAIATKIDYTINFLSKGHFTLRPSQEVLETMADPRKSTKTKYDLGSFTEIKDKKTPLIGRKKRKLLATEKKEEEKDDEEEEEEEEETDEEVPLKPSAKQVSKKQTKKQLSTKRMKIEEPKEEKPRKRTEERVEPPIEKPSPEELIEKEQKESTAEPKKEKEPVKIQEPLKMTDSIKKIPGITENHSQTLRQIGISIVDDLLFVDPDIIAENITDKSITAKNIREWQKIARSLL